MPELPNTSRTWKLGPGPGVAGSSGVLRSADYALHRFRDIGIAIPEPCRLIRAREYVLQVHERAIAPVDYALLAEATRTILEFYWIARASGGTAPRPEKELSRKLPRALSGELDPREEDNDSALPRNTQFELFAGAWLTSGGVAVRLGEPDLLAFYSNDWVGVAVKRVRSRRKILQRVHEASKQVSARTKTGFVILNVDSFLDEIEGDDPEQAGAGFESAVPEVDAAIDRLSEQAHIRGFIALGVSPRWVDAGDVWHLKIASFTKWRLFADSEADRAYGDNFLESFIRVQGTRMATF